MVSLFLFHPSPLPLVGAKLTQPTSYYRVQDVKWFCQRKKQEYDSLAKKSGHGKQVIHFSNNFYQQKT
jgi:hypothetical protein